MRTFLIVAAVILLAVAGFLLVATRGGNESAASRASTVERAPSARVDPGHAACTDATQPVRLTVPAKEQASPLNLVVPANYLGYSGNQAGGEQDLVKINAAFPSLEARPVGSVWSSCGGDASRKVPDAEAFSWAPDRLEIQIGGGAWGYVERPGEFVDTESGVPDLRHLQRPCAIDPSAAAPSGGCRFNEWFVPTASDELATSIECAGNVENPSASCKGTFVFRGRRVAVTFKRNRIAEWKPIVVGARDLLERFASAR